MYVVSVENITDPLFVFQDYGNDGLNFFAHYPTNVGVLILEIDFLIDLIFELYCIIFVISAYLLVSVPIQIGGCDQFCNL